MEAWLQDLPLGDRFAGAWLDSRADGHIYVAFAGSRAVDEARRNPALSVLANEPRVSFVERRFTVKELDEALDRSAAALNALLAAPPPEDREPWPFVGSVCTVDNVVDIAIDSSVAGRLNAARRALAAEIEAGIVRLRVDKVRQVQQAVTTG